MELPEQIQTFRDFLEVNEVYLRELHDQVRKGNAWFTVQFADLARHNPELAELLLEEPEDVLKAFQIAIDKMDLPRASEAAAPKIEPRIINLPPQQIIEIRNVRSKHLNRFVQLIGVVRQKSDVRPQMTSARFECPACGNIIPVLQIDQKFQEPSRCGCGRKGKFKLLTKELVDAQSITLEEAPEDLDGGEQPKRLKLFLKNDLVSPLSDKRTNPGSKITVVGVIKEVPIILQTGGQSTRFDLILEANALESIQEDFTEINISPEQEKDIRELSQDPDLFEKLVSSIAPNIYGHEPIKQALLLQMFGGVHKVRDKGIKSRGDIHMLLIGDPGSGKSVLLKRVSAIAPKARFVSGKGASGAGLTAAVVKDDFLKGWALEAGALVLANRGLCCTTADAAFIREDGVRMTFGELFENETQDLIRPGFRVLGLDTKDLKVKPFAIKQAFRTPNTKRVLEVTTRTGRTLKLTEDNEVFIREELKSSWRMIGELKKGNLLAVPKNLPLKDNLAHNPAFVEGDIFWDTIVSLKEVKADYVYDFTMIGTENFIANDIVMHNCIDELDKMTDEDTSAMHEALEQQCYDEETEVLVRSGWKRFKDTTMDDEFATLSPDGHLYYSKPSAIIKTEWKGGMYRIKSRRADLLVTPNHNMYAAVYKHGNTWHPYGLHKIADIADKRMKLKKDAVWLGTHQEWHTVPGVLKHKNQNASYTTGDITIRMDAWLEFLGWYLSEGSIRYMGDVPYSVMITQCKASGIKAIAHCLDKLPFTWKRHKDNFVINSKQLAMHLAVFGKAAQKHVPAYVKDLSREQINIFLEALMLGDGFSRTTAAGGPNRQYITSSSQLADDVQELLLKIGICGHKNPAAPKGTPIHIREKTVYSRNDCWSVQFVHSGIGHINTNGEKHITREKYQGMVYCAEVPDHTLYVRRNGVPVWCGNTISISKANIQATLRCETTVLAAANPKFGRFDPYEIISKQIELPPALLSRFDLIFPVRDLPDKAKDEKLASFILNRHKENLEVHEIITPERMRSYIAYARQTCHPRLTDAAILEIKEYYVKMRGGEDNPQTETALKPIPITARQLEALIRLAEASAKMRLSDRVTKRDAQVAIELVHYCLQQIGMDPETGKIDLDRVTSGIGASQRSHIQIVKELVKELEERVGKAIPIEEIVREAGIRGVADSTTEDVIEKLKRSGDVYSPKHGFISRT